MMLSPMVQSLRMFSDFFIGRIHIEDVRAPRAITEVHITAAMTRADQGKPFFFSLYPLSFYSLGSWTDGMEPIHLSVAPGVNVVSHHR